MITTHATTVLHLPDGDTIDLPEAGCTWQVRPIRNGQPWTTNFTVLQAICDIAGELHKYLPLGVRSFFYQLVARGVLENTKASYGRVKTILTEAREAGWVPFHWITDGTRAVHAVRQFQSAQGFIDDEVEKYLFADYRRDLLQDQATAIEVWTEKRGLVALMQRAAHPYGITVCAAAGHSSTSYLKKLAERVVAEFKATGRTTVVLYCGDHDPTGLHVPQNIEEKVSREAYGAAGLFEVERIALTFAQIQEHKLPPNADAAKEQDARFSAYTRRIADLGIDTSAAGVPAWELDALPPDVLVDIVQSAILRHVDQDKLQAQVATMESDVQHIAELRAKVQKLVQSEAGAP